MSMVLAVVVEIMGNEEGEGDKGRGGRVWPFVACLGQPTIDHASLSRLGTVRTFSRGPFEPPDFLYTSAISSMETLAEGGTGGGDCSRAERQQSTGRAASDLPRPAQRKTTPTS